MTITSNSYTNSKTFHHYLVFWSAQMSSLLGSSIVQFVIVWWITITTESTYYLALASFLAFGPQVLFMPFAGVLADRWNRKYMIGFPDFFQTLSTIALIVIFYFGNVTIAIVLVIAFFRGSFQAMQFPAVNAVIPIMVPGDKLSRINGLNYLFTGLINITGPVVAAALLSIFEIKQILFADPLTFIIAVIPLFLISIPSVKKKQDQKNPKKNLFFHEFKAGLKILSGIPGLVALVFLATAINFFAQPFDTLLPYFVKITHNGNAQDLAYVMAFFQGGIALGSIIVTLKKIWKKKILIITWGIIISDTGYIIAALAPHGMFFVMWIGGIIMGFTIPFINTMFLTVLQTVVPPEAQGRIISIVVALATAVSPIGMIISGPLAGILGIVPLFILFSSLSIISVPVTYVLGGLKNVDYDKLIQERQEEKIQIENKE